ncbi:hypothetical protein M885DRAFT_14993 [Pelagophyceae sp. CCMP2097]|nr:hypothetical protein M885DRAFT_14993 [Pelagophyceae sp. CCMP2097]
MAEAAADGGQAAVDAARSQLAAALDSADVDGALAACNALRRTLEDLRQNASASDSDVSESIISDVASISDVFSDGASDCSSVSCASPHTVVFRPVTSFLVTEATLAYRGPPAPPDMSQALVVATRTHASLEFDRVLRGAARAAGGARARCRARGGARVVYAVGRLCQRRRLHEANLPPGVAARRRQARLAGRAPRRRDSGSRRRPRRTPRPRRRGGPRRRRPRDWRDHPPPPEEPAARSAPVAAPRHRRRGRFRAARRVRRPRAIFALLEAARVACRADGKRDTRGPRRAQLRRRRRVWRGRLRAARRAHFGGVRARGSVALRRPGDFARFGHFGLLDWAR